MRVEDVVTLMLLEMSPDVIQSGGHIFRKRAERLYHGKTAGSTDIFELREDGKGWTCRNTRTGDAVPALCSSETTGNPCAAREWGDEQTAFTPAALEPATCVYVVLDGKRVPGRVLSLRSGGIYVDATRQFFIMVDPSTNIVSVLFNIGRQSVQLFDNKSDLGDVWDPTWMQRNDHDMTSQQWRELDLYRDVANQYSREMIDTVTIESMRARYIDGGLVPLMVVVPLPAGRSTTLDVVFDTSAYYYTDADKTFSIHVFNADAGQWMLVRGADVLAFTDAGAFSLYDANWRWVDRPDRVVQFTTI